MTSFLGPMGVPGAQPTAIDDPLYGIKLQKMQINRRLSEKSVLAFKPYLVFRTSQPASGCSQPSIFAVYFAVSSQQGSYSRADTLRRQFTAADSLW